MKKINNHFENQFPIIIKTIAIVIAFSFVSCKKSKVSLTKEFKNCNFEYMQDKTQITWTAYKFTNKVGVKGTFDEHLIQDFQKENSMKSSIEKVSFTLPISTINSKDPSRDEKIKQHLFGSMVNTANIEGRIVNITGNTMQVSLSLNNVSKIVRGSIYPYYNTKEKQNKDEPYQVKLKTEIDLRDFQADQSVSALNKVCEALHIGVDGKSKLWPDVNIQVDVYLKKVCL